jgi:hypothetical protein
MLRKAILVLLIPILITKVSAQSFVDINADISGIYFAATGFADVNNDGHLDLLITGIGNDGVSLTKLYFGDGENFDEITSTGLPQLNLGAIAWYDVNQDSYPDLLLQGYIEETQTPITDLYYNNGDGTFTPQNIGLPQTYQGDIQWVDMNNDGLMDFSLTGYVDSDGIYISNIYKNNGDGTFTDINAGIPGTILGKMKWADYDSDGDQDFILTGSSFSGFETAIWKNNGDETFTQQSNNLQILWLGDVEWVDYDGDGHIDLFLSGDNGGTKYAILYKNQGDGSFTDSGNVFTGVSHSSVEFADFDSDGDLDLFIAGTQDAMGSGAYIGTVYTNESGQFSEAVNLPGTYWGDCHVADYNSDGKPDIYINGYNTNENPFSALMKNEGVSAVPDFQTAEILLYPNPAKNFINLTTDTSNKHIRIIDFTGKEILSTNLSGKQNQIDIGLLKPGVYMFMVKDDTEFAVKRFTVIR